MHAIHADNIPETVMRQAGYLFRDVFKPLGKVSPFDNRDRHGGPPISDTRYSSRRILRCTR
jgi:hypothetical protein